MIPTYADWVDYWCVHDWGEWLDADGYWRCEGCGRVMGINC